MKTKTLCALVFLTAHLALSEECRYETATGSKSITIADYETGELISVLNTNVASTAGHPYYVAAQKDGYVLSLKSAASYYYPVAGAATSSGVGDIIRGPATFYLIDTGSAQAFTVKITPVSFPPNKTLIVPPGTNQVQISLEASTNLVNWAVATNGVYGSPDSAYFFRMRMTKLQP